MPLERLLSVAVLTPAQAAFVAVRLLDASEATRTADEANTADAGLWTVALTPAGDVDVGRAQAGEGAPVAELLSQLSHNARRLQAHPRPEQLVLLRRLEEAAADPQLEPCARARELEVALAEVLGARVRQRLSGQFAALVGAFAHIAPSVPAPEGVLAAPGRSRREPRRAAPVRTRPSRPPWRGRTLTHRRARTRRMALAVLLLATALAGSGYVLLRSSDVGTAGALGRDKSPAAPSKPTPPDSSNQPGKQPPAQPGSDLAARRAGPITGVRLQKTGTCRPGAPCPVTVTVQLRSAATARPVIWKVGAVRGCGSDVTWSPPVTVTAQPGWTTVYASSSIAVPRGSSPALVALATAPARAQSPPVPVTGSSLRC